MKNNKTYHPKGKKQNRAVKKNNPPMTQRREGYVAKILPKTISRTRADVSTWKSALRAADNVEIGRAHV